MGVRKKAKIPRTMPSEHLRFLGPLLCWSPSVSLEHFQKDTQKTKRAQGLEFGAGGATTTWLLGRDLREGIGPWHTRQMSELYYVVLAETL